MTSLKKYLTAIIFMLVVALALTACGGGDTLEGTYVVEGDEDSGVSITFTGDTFSFILPYSEVELEYNLPGNFVLSGTFTVDNSNNIVLLNIDDDALRTSVTDMVDVLFEYILSGPEFAEFLDDPEFEEFVTLYIEAMLDDMHDELFHAMHSEFTDIGFRFSNNFDRLYDDTDNTVFVRQ
ncbi:MAG: hypothetical protein FWC92_09880 [Defluviitaleaceae bacterium]|nr:hypothetical protein [Defluviitaleaceae bacterium]